MPNLYQNKKKSGPSKLVLWVIKSNLAKDENSANNFLLLITVFIFVTIAWVFVNENKPIYIDQNLIDNAGSPNEIINS